MKLKKLKNRRTLRRSDFRKHTKKDEPGIPLCEGEGHIDVVKINEVFPNNTERNEYINSLIKAMEE